MQRKIFSRPLYKAFRPFQYFLRLQHFDLTYKILSQLHPNIALLGQLVHSLELSICKKKLKAVRLLKYAKTLRALEYYHGLIKYFRSYIHYYAQLASPLQALKTSFFKKALEDGQ